MRAGMNRVDRKFFNWIFESTILVILAALVGHALDKLLGTRDEIGNSPERRTRAVAKPGPLLPPEAGFTTMERIVKGEKPASAQVPTIRRFCSPK